MRTMPVMRIKTVEELVPGELVVAEIDGRRVHAIFTHLVREGDPLFVLLYLIHSSNRFRGPFYAFESDRLLSLGTEYAFIIDPIVQPTSSPRTSGVQLLISNDQRLLRVWDRNGSFSLALNLDSGVAQSPPNLARSFECFAWEVRLKVNGAIDFRSPPLFRWDEASTTKSAIETQ